MKTLKWNFGPDWLFKNHNKWESGGKTLRKKWWHHVKGNKLNICARKRCQKLCAHFCLWPLVTLERCAKPWLAEFSIAFRFYSCEVCCWCCLYLGVPWCLWFFIQEVEKRVFRRDVNHSSVGRDIPKGSVETPLKFKPGSTSHLTKKIHSFPPLLGCLTTLSIALLQKI